VLQWELPEKLMLERRVMEQKVPEWKLLTRSVADWQTSSLRR
jgi:hypothetical protein